MTEKIHHTDIVKEGWIGKTPESMRPYLYLMRLDRPIGTWLLLLPAWWTILLGGGFLYMPTLILFAIGAIVMRAAGCIVNDLWDRNLDGNVERTSTRPLPSGDVTVRQALNLLGGLLLVGLIILLQFNLTTILIGIASLGFVAVYPLMKRWTWWPQAFLGLTFNFGAIMGWTSIYGFPHTEALIIYAAGFFWTLVYDTIYAFQDREDDATLGLKSTARLFTEKFENVKIALIAFAMIHGILLMVGSYLTFKSFPLIGFPLFILPFAHLAWQIKTLSINDHKNTLKRFKSNRDYGLLVCVVIMIIHLIV